jgi:hypothetical protein
MLFFIPSWTTKQNYLLRASPYLISLKFKVVRSHASWVVWGGFEGGLDGHLRLSEASLRLANFRISLLRRKNISPSGFRRLEFLSACAKNLGDDYNGAFSLVV